MSTRSFICKEQTDGSYYGIYCHWDGYLTNNGALLLDHYSDKNKLDELLALGDIASLHEDVYSNPTLSHSFENSQENVTVAYHRDRGEEIHKARIISLDDAIDSWCDYMYIFGQDGVWRYFDLLEKEPELRFVETDLNAEYEKMGIQRPPNSYGWFLDEEIKQIKAKHTKSIEKEM